MPHEENAVVLPLHGQGDGGDPRRMLADQRAVLVSWADGGTSSGTGWGPQLDAASGVGQALTEIVKQSGTRLGASSAIFRVEVAAGQTLHNLVPAVGGGFRGMTRSAGGIASHARLLPVGGAAVGAVALGPLLAVVAVTAGCEMVAQYEQRKRLEAIGRVVRGLQKRARQEDVARLTTAEEVLRKSTAALLDKIAVPESVGLGSASYNLRQFRNVTLGWLASWEAGAREVKIGKTGVSLGDVERVLGGPVGDVNDFPPSVALLYQAVTLHSRMILLESTEAAVRNPTSDLLHVNSHVAADLAENAQVQERLRTLLLDVVEWQVTVGLPKRPGTSDKVQQVDAMLRRVATSMVRTSPTLPMLTDRNTLVLEAQRNDTGEVRLLQPSA